MPIVLEYCTQLEGKLLGDDILSIAAQIIAGSCFNDICCSVVRIKRSKVQMHIIRKTWMLGIKIKFM